MGRTYRRKPANDEKRIHGVPKSDRARAKKSYREYYPSPNEPVLTTKEGDEEPPEETDK